MLSRNVLILLMILVASIVAYIAYLSITYIDEKVTKGEAYGFRIGDSKMETYEKARTIFKEKKVFILYPLDQNDYGPHREYTFSDDEYSLIANRERWEFLFDEGFRDFIELEFRESGLASSIYRHRQKFELP